MSSALAASPRSMSWSVTSTPTSPSGTPIQNHTSGEPRGLRSSPKSNAHAQPSTKPPQREFLHSNCESGHYGAPAPQAIFGLGNSGGLPRPGLRDRDQGSGRFCPGYQDRISALVGLSLIP